MPREILSEFGPDAAKPQAPKVVSGGVYPLDVKDVMNYQSPLGPTTFGHQGPGLAQRNNYGNCGSQGRYGGGDNNG